MYDNINDFISVLIDQFIQGVYSNTADKICFLENGIISALDIVFCTVVCVLGVLLAFLLLSCFVRSKKHEHHWQKDQTVEEPKYHGEGNDLEESDEGVRLGEGQEDECQECCHTPVQNCRTYGNESAQCALLS